MQRCNVMKKSSIAGLVVVASLWVSWVSADLPLQRIAVFNSGVAYFEHAGMVTADADIPFTFREEQIKDVIKSIFALDMDGGAVTGIIYDALDPVQRYLQSLPVDVSDHPPVATLLQRLRGVEIAVELSGEDVEGRVVGVETRSQAESGVRVEASYLNLRTEAGLRSLPLSAVRAWRLSDPELADALEAALDRLAGSLDRDRKQVTIQFRGSGTRSVHVGYLLEAPVWKTSYRLVMDGAAGQLQGWGHLENVTDQDWDKVTLSLVSGRPLSFIQDLYQPRYVQRPVIEPTDQYAVAPPEDRGIMRARRPAQTAMLASPASPMMDFAAAPEWGRAEIADQAIMADAAEAGELVVYTVKEPVQIARQSGAMLPILQASVTLDRVSLYNAETHPRHPLNAVALTNATDTPWMAGPVTIVDEESYAGEARLPELRPRESRMLSYALDQAITVQSEAVAAPERITRMRIDQGVLISTRSLRRTTTYHIRHSRDQARDLIIEHPYRANWALLQPDTAPDRSESHWRFRVSLPADDSFTWPVVEERITEQTVRIGSLDDQRIAFFLQQRSISDSLQQTLAELSQRRRALHAQQQRVRDLEQQVGDAAALQAELRENMQAVPSTSASFSGWERELVEQSRVHRRLTGEWQAARAKRAEMEADLEAWMTSLTLE